VPAAAPVPLAAALAATAAANTNTAAALAAATAAATAAAPAPTDPRLRPVRAETADRRPTRSLDDHYRRLKRSLGLSNGEEYDSVDEYDDDLYKVPHFDRPHHP
jgi:hypothetical protein